MTYGDYPNLEGVKKILIIKLRQLGDVLLTAPLISTLKGRFPGSVIDAYVYTEAFPMLEGHPGIDGLIGYDRQWKKLPFWKRGAKEGALWRHLRKGGYDLVLNLTEGDRGAIAAWMTGAPIRVGFDPKGGWQKKLYTHRIKHCPSLRHTVERNLDAARRLGIFPNWEERELFFHIPEKARQKVSLKEGSFVVIHPTSRWRFKCWSIEKMRQLAQSFLQQGMQVVFTSGPDLEEKAMVEEIARDLPVLNLSGQISLKELGAWIEQSALLVCVDSLPFHLANALKKPVVALFGPTSEITWGPWRNPQARIVAQNWSCRPCYQDGCGGSKKSDCLAILSVSAVWEAVVSCSSLSAFV